ncbi:hypothetical protein Tco_0820370 [Tanacetum coccineum]|uniref:Uncharacterized protein n=1 Tax=Tanacetum coccineum TaxID=301880 RepID=A0ABQ5AA43_9ASTR
MLRIGMIDRRAGNWKLQSLLENGRKFSMSIYWYCPSPQSSPVITSSTTRVFHVHYCKMANLHPFNKILASLSVGGTDFGLIGANQKFPLPPSNKSYFPYISDRIKDEAGDSNEFWRSIGFLNFKGPLLRGDNSVSIAKTVVSYRIRDFLFDDSGKSSPRADLKDVSEDFQIEVEFLLLVHFKPVGNFLLVDRYPSFSGHVHFRHNLASDEKMWNCPE